MEAFIGARRIVLPIVEESGKRILVRPVDRQKHFMQITQSWNFHEKVLDRATLLGVDTLRIVERSGAVLEVPFETAKTEGYAAPGTRGYGSQWAIPERLWTKVR